MLEDNTVGVFSSSQIKKGRKSNSQRLCSKDNAMPLYGNAS